MSIITKIIDKKRLRLKALKAKEPLPAIRKRAEDKENPRDFKAAITREEGDSLKLIAELKKASPSKGLIRADFDPRAIATIYGQKADAMSVLTEEDFFQGNLQFVEQAKDVAPCPALRKDFIFDEYQIYEARAAGADAILLIEMALDGAQAVEYLALARELGMAVLFEAHDGHELERALKAGADILGVNNRDLRTLEISLETTFALRGEVPKGVTMVSESGISTRADVLRLEEAGVDAMLVGTSIMRESDIAAKIDSLRKD
jgi:indole-3-glycerol phosphate synthase